MAQANRLETRSAYMHTIHLRLTIAYVGQILSRGLDQIKAEHVEAFRQEDKQTRFVDVYKAEYHTDGSTSVFVRYTAGIHYTRTHIEGLSMFTFLCICQAMTSSKSRTCATKRRMYSPSV